MSIQDREQLARIANKASWQSQLRIRDIASRGASNLFDFFGLPRLLSQPRP
jgi:hypothetical protein